MKPAFFVLALLALIAFPFANLNADDFGNPDRNGAERGRNATTPPDTKTRTLRVREDGLAIVYVFTEGEDGKMHVKESRVWSGGIVVKEYDFVSVEDMKNKDSKLYGYYEQAMPTSGGGGQQNDLGGGNLRQMMLENVLRYLESGEAGGEKIGEALQIAREKLVELLKRLETEIKKREGLSLEELLDLRLMSWRTACICGGLRVRPIDEVAKAQLKLTDGLAVMDVKADSAFATAGIMKYDIITEVRGAKIDSVESLNKALTENAGKKAEIKIIREGGERKIEMTVPEVPAPDAPKAGGEEEKGSEN